MLFRSLVEKDVGVLVKIHVLSSSLNAIVVSSPRRGSCESVRERETSAVDRANRKIIVRNEIIAALLGSFLAQAVLRLHGAVFPQPNHLVLLSLPRSRTRSKLGSNIS